jgi:hypothetical protein
MAISAEKQPDCLHRVVRFRHVQVESRYGKRRELCKALSALQHIDEWRPETVQSIRSVFVDSKAQDAFRIDVHSDELTACADLADTALIAAGGHNGCLVTDGETEIEIAPFWPEDRL